MLQRFRAVMAILVLCASPSAATAAKRLPRMLVRNLEVSGGSVRDLQAVESSVLTGATHYCEDYSPIGVRDIDAALKTQKLMDALGCNTDNCMLDAAEMVNASRVARVVLTQLADEQWKLSASLLDVETGRIVERAELPIRGGQQALGSQSGFVMWNLCGHSGLPPDYDAKITAATRMSDVGFGSRVGGMTLTVVGTAAAAAGIGFSIAKAAHETCKTITPDPINNPGYSYQECHGPGLQGVAVPLIGTVGAITLVGVGSGIYLDGKAQGLRGTSDVTASVWWRWLGWGLLGLGIAGPIYADNVDNSGLTWTTAVLGLVGSTTVFLLSTASPGTIESDAGIRSLGLQWFRTRENHLTPGLALTSVF
jgi:hypothetical protein